MGFILPIGRNLFVVDNATNETVLSFHGYAGFSLIDNDWSHDFARGISDVRLSPNGREVIAIEGGKPRRIRIAGDGPQLATPS